MRDVISNIIYISDNLWILSLLTLLDEIHAWWIMILTPKISDKGYG